MQTQDVELGFLATPESGPCPGVVLIHDVWGLTDHARDLAQRLSGEGFAVLALDLYRRLDEVKIENPGEWMRALSDPQILGDVQAGADFLAAHAITQGRDLPGNRTDIALGAAAKIDGKVINEVGAFAAQGYANGARGVQACQQTAGEVEGKIKTIGGTARIPGTKTGDIAG